MKITQGFAAVTPDGEFLHISARQTHTGYRVVVTLVADIDDATVQRIPAMYTREENEALDEHRAKWVPVEVQRNVILKGYGNAG